MHYYLFFEQNSFKENSTKRMIVLCEVKFLKRMEKKSVPFKKFLFAISFLNKRSMSTDSPTRTLSDARLEAIEKTLEETKRQIADALNRPTDETLDSTEYLPFARERPFRYLWIPVVANIILATCVYFYIYRPTIFSSN